MLPLQPTGEVQITEATPPKPPREAGPLDPRVVFWGLRSMATARGLSLPRERANGPGQDTENTKAETKPGDSGLLAKGLKFTQLSIPKWCLCI